MHPARDREVKPHHQAGNLQTNASIPNQPQRTTHLASRFHPMGGSFAHTAQKGYDSEKVFNYIRDAQQRKTRLLKRLSDHMESFSHKDAAE